MGKFKTLALDEICDSRGSLTVLENCLPFEVRRIFWITGASNQRRGGHRHRVTRQALVAVAGTVRVFMDNGKDKATVDLNRPSKCLLVEPADWHWMEFGDQAVLLVFASHLYDAADYISEPYSVGSLP